MLYGKTHSGQFEEDLMICSLAYSKISAKISDRKKENTTGKLLCLHY